MTAENPICAVGHIRSSPSSQCETYWMCCKSRSGADLRNTCCGADSPDSELGSCTSHSLQLTLNVPLAGTAAGPGNFPFIEPSPARLRSQSVSMRVQAGGEEFTLPSFRVAVHRPRSRAVPMTSVEARDSGVRARTFAVEEVFFCVIQERPQSRANSRRPR